MGVPMKHPNPVDTADKKEISQTPSPGLGVTLAAENAPSTTQSQTQALQGPVDGSHIGSLPASVDYRSQPFPLLSTWGRILSGLFFKIF